MDGGASPLTVAVYGLGAVGGYCAARLAESGAIVYGIARKGPHFDAIAQHGIKLLSCAGDCQVPLTKVTADPSEVGPVDLVLVACKHYALEETAASLKPLMGPHTLVIPLLNGIEAPQAMAAALRPTHVLGGFIHIFAVKEGAGVVRHSSVSPVLVVAGALPGTGEFAGEGLARVQECFSRTVALRMRVEADIRLGMWRKLIGISAFSGICSLGRAPVGPMFACGATEQLFLECIREGRTVAEAEGVVFPPDFKAEDMLAHARSFGKLDPTAWPSLSRDFLGGRPSEMDQQVGILVKRAAVHKLPLPIFTTMYALMQLAASGGHVKADIAEAEQPELDPQI